MVLAAVFYGLGLGPIEWRSQTFIKHGFTKQRVLALGVSTMGISLAGIVFPWLLRHLTREYGLGGSSLLLGAITLNGCVGSLLQQVVKPPETAHSHPGVLRNGHIEMRVVRKRKDLTDHNVEFASPVQTNLQSSSELQHPADGKPEGAPSGDIGHDYSYQKLRSVSSSNVCDYSDSTKLEGDGGLGLGRLALSQDTVYEDCQSDFDPCELEGLPTFKRRRLLTEGSESYVSCYSILESSPYDIVETKDTGEVTIHRRSVSSESIVMVPVPSRQDRTLASRLTVFVDPCKALLKNGMFYICTLSFFLLYMINVVYSSTALDFAVDKGVLQDEVVALLTYFSLADAVARLATSVLVNSELVSKKLLMMWVQCSSGVLLLASPYLVGYWAMLLTSLLLGLNLGCLAVLHITLFEDYLELRRVAWAFNLYHLLIAIISLVVAPIIGHCRDTLGSYDVLFQVLGLLCLLNVFFWVFAEPFFKKQRFAKRKKQENSPT